MKSFKRIISILLSALLICSTAAIAGAEGDAPAQTDFVPVIRFVAASDTHIRDDNDATYNRIGKMMEMAYADADSNPAYDKLDAVLICGDLTNDGTKSEFDKFQKAVSGSLRDGTQFLGVVAKNHDGYKMSHSELRSYYKNLTGNDADFHKVINGFHFIGVSASEIDVQHYDQGQISRLKEELDKATAEVPDRPVFIMHHEHNRDTVYGSSSYDGWGVTYFNSTLKQYPQVVDFSGHSHYPLNDPRSLWQGEYTAIGTGAVYYSEFTVDATRTYHPDDAYSTATFWIVELDSANRMHLRGFDIEAGEMLCEYLLENPANPENREYTVEKRKAASKPPVFEEGAEIDFTGIPGGFNASVPAAASADGMPVVLYRYKVINKLGLTEKKGWVLPKYYLAGEHETVGLKITGLAAGDYKIEVLAETAYGVDSETISAQVTV
ncbi:MAG: metallophosphoesterase, partial [Clostridia bacterium]|nr:metallophosphoesterase [Clostridia bacterium]